MEGALSLLNDSSDEDSNAEFTINTNYANRYDVWRKNEEMQKLKDLSKNESDSSSESESEEEPKIEKEFFKVISRLKSKDPNIYNKDVEYFKEDKDPGREDQNIEKKTKSKKEKPMFMKDYERKVVLERNGKFSDDEEHIPATGRTFKEEEEEIKKIFKAVLEDSDDENVDEEDILHVRSKTKAEEEAEEADYLQWFKGQKKDIEDEDKKEMSFLRQFWNDPKIDSNEKFLRDFLLEQKYVVNDKTHSIPTYNEITDDIGMLSEDERVVEQQEQFEHKYNFRFEEPDTEFIKCYPRTIGDSLRRADNKRKLKREEYADRKKKEKEQKKEELKRLKALKRKEIEEKFLKLKEISGQEQLNFDEEDIESDFDPDKHDRKMKELFNDDYYNVEEQQKPEFEYDEDLDDEKWDHWSREQNNAIEMKTKSNQNDNVEEDSSTDESNQKIDSKLQFEQEMIESTRFGRKKGKKKSLFAKIISEPKPIYDPDGKSFDDYLDEYYKLDYEDVIGDLPVRFKYRKVLPNDFGLTVDEILAANDKELNRWCSVKKTCQYRHEDEEKYDVQAFQKKAQNVDVKQKILSSVYSQPKEEDAQMVNTGSKDESNKPKRKKRRPKKKKNAEISNKNNVKELEGNDKVETLSLNDTPECEESPSLNVHSKSKKKRKKNKKLSQESSSPNVPNLPSNTYEEENFLVINKNMNSSLNMTSNDTSKADISSTKKSKRKKDSSKLNSSFEEIKITNLEDSTNISPKGYQLNNTTEKEEGSNLSINESNNLEINSKSVSGSINKVKNKVKRILDDSVEENNSDSMHVKRRKKDVEHEDNYNLNSSVNQSNTSPKHDSINNSNQNTGETATKVSQAKKKPKKKKKFKKDQDSFRNPYKQDFSARSIPSGVKAQQKSPETEMKLALSDARLSAFQINPKKFKNRLIYSKK